MNIYTTTDLLICFTCKKIDQLTTSADEFWQLVPVTPVQVVVAVATILHFCS